MVIFHSYVKLPEGTWIKHYETMNVFSKLWLDVADFHVHGQMLFFFRF